LPGSRFQYLELLLPRRHKIDRLPTPARALLVRVVEHELRGGAVDLVVHLPAEEVEYRLWVDQDQGKGSARSARPDAKPRIWHNYFATEEDRRSVIAGIRISMEMMKHEALRAITRKPHLLPTSTSDGDIWAHVKKTCHTTYHPMELAEVRS
jgi:GMC oxidoreductase